MISHNLPVLVVLVPLLAALIAPLCGRGRLPWLLAMLATLCAFVLSLWLLNRVLHEGIISYALGGWAPPWGIEYRVDKLNAFLLLIVSGAAFIITPFALLSVEREVAADRRHFFYAAYLLCITGLLGITITGDAFNLYVLLEVSSLATYTLVAMGERPRALTASFHYLVLGTLGATLLLIGIGHLYMATGTLNMHDLSLRLPALQDNRTVRTGFAFIMVGVSLKLALFPLHAWLPNAYTHAPSVVSALLAATATKVGAYVLLRFLFTIFGLEFSIGLLHTDTLLLLFSSVAILYGSAMALRQDNVKRLLAYSSVAQIGYLVLGFGLVSVTGLSGGIVHLFNHALTKGALFLALGCVFYRVGAVRLQDLHGLARHMPWTCAAIVLGGLSLIGIPATAGFISKWYLLLASLQQGAWWLVVVIVLGSLLAVAYLWRVVEAMYFQPSPKGQAAVQEAPWSMLLPTWLLIGATIYFGIQAKLTTGLATQAAQSLLGVAP